MVLLRLQAGAGPGAAEHAGEHVDQQVEGEPLVTGRRSPDRKQGTLAPVYREVGRVEGRLAAGVDEPALGSGLAGARRHLDLAGRGDARGEIHDDRIPRLPRDAGVLPGLCSRTGPTPREGPPRGLPPASLTIIRATIPCRAGSPT